MRKSFALLPALSLLVLWGQPVAAGQGRHLVFPAHHLEFLSGGAYASIVGPDTGARSAGPASVQQQATPSVGPNVQVNALQRSFPNGLLGRSETTVAGTADGQQIVAGFNDAQGFCGAPFGRACTPPANPGLSGFAFSTDGGAHWTDSGVGLMNDASGTTVFTRGDPWLDRGGLDGDTFYFANLSVRYPDGADLGVSVHRGHFTGSGFAFDDVHLLPPPNPNDFYDKEAIATAKDGSGAGLVSLTNFVQTCNIPANGFGQIEIWRTHDAGNTWQGPSVVSPDQTFVTDPSNPSCGNSGVLQQSSAPAVGPNGELYVAWQLGPTLSASAPPSTNAAIKVARSLDGGVTFGAPVTVAAINSMRQNPLVGFNRNRINDHPRIAVDATGTHRGRVYLTYYSAAQPATSPDTVDCPGSVSTTATCVGQSLISSQAFLSFSDDQGLTWSQPTPIAPMAANTVLKRLWPVVSVQPNGTVDVTYYESREQDAQDGSLCTLRVSRNPLIYRTGDAHSLVNTFWVQSHDGGVTFSAPRRVSSATSDWCTTVSDVTPNFGDYIGSASAAGRVLSTWADGRNGVPDTFYATGFGT
jgi:hypothetical protein